MNTATHERALGGERFWFPGRWVGGTALIVGPLVLLSGVLIRTKFHFFFPQQLQAFHEAPRLITASYNCFWAGNILLWPAILTLVNLTGRTRPRWAIWGGCLVMFGLFARTFHGGIDHLAFQLVRVQGVEPATKTVASSYGAFHVVTALNGTILFGWLVLAAGAYVSRILSMWRCISLALMSGLMMGVLKGSSPMSVVSVLGLCFAFVPLGLKVLREHPTPPIRSFALWFLFLGAFSVLLHYFGQLG